MGYSQPDQQGHFDIFGGKYVPETLIPAINELEKLYYKIRDDNTFQYELSLLRKNYHNLFSSSGMDLLELEHSWNDLSSNCICTNARDNSNHGSPTVIFFSLVCIEIRGKPLIDCFFHLVIKYINQE